MRLKIWGVRGSTPTPEIENLAYGGNTSCIEIRSDSNQVYIFDGGSGVRNLGQALMAEAKDEKLSVHMFLTHYHWDHIQGIPFFAPLYRSENEMSFYASCALGSVQERRQGQMSRPYFPVNMDQRTHPNFVEFDTRDLRVGDLVIHPFPLNHPQGAYGYRIASGPRVVVYATDLEHGHPELDRVLRDYCQQADILIYDSHYTPEEYEAHRGWGHSTWLEATRVARDTGVKQLILFHHDPARDDQMVWQVVQQARLEFENTIAAKESWSISL